MLAYYPPDSVNDIRFAATVWSNDSRYGIIKYNVGLVSKRLKPFYFKRL